MYLEPEVNWEGVIWERPSETLYSSLLVMDSNPEK